MLTHTPGRSTRNAKRNRHVSWLYRTILWVRWVIRTHPMGRSQPRSTVPETKRSISLWWPWLSVNIGADDGSRTGNSTDGRQPVS